MYRFGNPDAEVVLIQAVGDDSFSDIENEVDLIRKKSGKEFSFLAVKVEDWNNQLSPWNAPAAFGKEDFGNGAKETLDYILQFCTDPNKTYYIGGYSLSGLFALWAAYQTDCFSGVASASPSMWFPGFVDYMKTNRIHCKKVYLSLGDREEKTKNPVISQVGACIKEGNDILLKRGIASTLVWNKGNHFTGVRIRTADAFAWVLEQ